MILLLLLLLLCFVYKSANEVVGEAGLVALSEWAEKRKGDISSIVNSGLIKKLWEDIERDMPAKKKKNMLRVLKSLIKKGVDGKEMEEGILIVMKIEEEAEKKGSEWNKFLH